MSEAGPQLKRYNRPLGINTHGHASREPDDPLLREYLNIPMVDGVVRESHRRRMAEIRVLLAKRYPRGDVLQHINNGFGSSHWNDETGERR